MWGRQEEPVGAFFGQLGVIGFLALQIEENHTSTQQGQNLCMSLTLGMELGSGKNNQPSLQL